MSTELCNGSTLNPQLLYEKVRIRYEINVTTLAEPLGRCLLCLQTPSNPQPASRAEVSRRAGLYRPGGSPFSSLGYRSGECMEGFRIRRWYIILPWCRSGSFFAPVGGFHVAHGVIVPGSSEL